MSGLRETLWRWVDSWHAAEGIPDGLPQRVDWPRVVPFLALHLACAAVLLVGWSWTAVAVAAALYAVRMVAITGFYHRYFSHRAFKTSRPAQLAFAVLGASAAQRGPLWWAAHHRHHHAHSDGPEDPHSPVQHSFLWSHVGWITSRANFKTRLHLVPDLAKYPELVFLDRFDTLVPALLAASLWLAGAALERWAPGLGVTSWQLLVWGFVVSTVVLLHATLCINSLAHVWGRKRYETGDQSRNSLALALLTFGEGWHDNHHHYPASARQGFFWWEVDLTYLVLKALEWTGLAWDLHPVPAHARARRPPRAAA